MESGFILTSRPVSSPNGDLPQFSYQRFPLQSPLSEKHFNRFSHTPDASGNPPSKTLRLRPSNSQECSFRLSFNMRSCLKFLAILKRMDFQGAVSGFCLQRCSMIAWSRRNQSKLWFPARLSLSFAFFTSDSSAILLWKTRRHPSKSPPDDLNK